MYQSKRIPGPGGFAELPGCAYNFVCLQDRLRLRIGTVCHVFMFEKTFGFIENIVHRGDRVIVYFGHFFFKIAELAW